MDLYTGRIIYWNGVFGFIIDGNQSVFFHKSQLMNGNVKLLEKVSFNTKIVDSGVHMGKINAINVEAIGEPINLNEFSRFVGKLTHWSQYKGTILSPQQSLPIYFYQTRKLYKEDSFNQNDLIVFCPVKSAKNENELFALFAYPISRETSIEFLLKQYHDSGIEAIVPYINKLLLKSNFTPEDRLIVKINLLTRVSDVKSYTQLVTLLKEFNIKNSNLVFAVLKERCDDVYLIQLFEQGLIDDYDIELLKSYFHKANADIKRQLVSKIQQQDRKELLMYHIHQLRETGRFEYLNDEIKTLLDIIHRNHNTKVEDLYNLILEELLQKLDNTEIANLWLNNYIDTITELILVEQFNFKDFASFNLIRKKNGEKFEKARAKLFEHYFASFEHKNFDQEYVQLIKVLTVFSKQSEARYQEIIRVLNYRFNDNQKFILRIFGVDKIIFDISKVETSGKIINDFYKLKYLLLCRVNSNELNVTNFENEITFSGLIDFAKSNPWNELLFPINAILDDGYGIHSFIQDVMSYDNSFDCKELAETIFQTMPKYNVHHVRLWLQKFVNDELYDYYGFRKGFKQLTLDEKTEYRSRVKPIFDTNFVHKSLNEVCPCEIIIEETTSEISYSARLYNFFFLKENLRLRKHDGVYTISFAHNCSTLAFNQIPEKDILSKMEIVVKVNKATNQIVSVKGLEEIYNTIHTGNIEVVLGKTELGYGDRPLQVPYMEDIKLIEQVTQFLYDEQIDDVEVMLVNEPTNYKRRLDTPSGIDSYQVTALFSILAKNEIGIVWNNIDFSEDRAIYVFKTTQDNLKNQLSKLAHTIATTSQLRSTLISDENDIMHNLFRANLGYLGCIKKSRGKMDSFERYLNKLSELLEKSAALLPTKAEQEEIRNWNPGTKHMVHLGKKNRYVPITPINQPKPMTKDDIVTLSEEAINTLNTTTQKNGIVLEESTLKRKKSIYNFMKSINELANTI